MAPELLALVDKPHLLVIVLLAGAAIGMAVENLMSRYRRQLWRERNLWRSNRNPWHSKGNPNSQPNGGHSTKALDAADQLRVVMGADFSVQPLLNRSETRLFKEVERIVSRCNSDWRVMAQVSLGEILRSASAEAYSCINAKRVDLLLIDEHCRPKHAIEYQGSGHHKTNAAARDAVKKEALRRAGITYHEVVAGQTTPTELCRLVERLVVPLAQPRRDVEHAVPDHGIIPSQNNM
jgi:hypothetical protein